MCIIHCTCVHCIQNSFCFRVKRQIQAPRDEAPLQHRAGAGRDLHSPRRVPEGFDRAVPELGERIRAPSPGKEAILF